MKVWTGLFLCVVAFVSYFAYFSRFEATRDVPWVPFLLFALALYLLISGWRQARRKILASVGVVLGLAVIGLFTYSVTVGSKDLPASASAPRVGQKAPDFALPDTQGRTVSLSQTLAGSKGVLLVFYRGYW
jgi:energy-coupling factor transporter transmembrane protein EcfT